MRGEIGPPSAVAIIRGSFSLARMTSFTGGQSIALPRKHARPTTAKLMSRAKRSEVGLPAIALDEEQGAWLRGLPRRALTERVSWVLLRLLDQVGRFRPASQCQRS
jgi:hypothetical protein